MTTPRKRARQACIACNSRRVKCNAAEEVPCRNCITTGDRCEIRESRRGKHPRVSRKSATGPSNSHTPNSRNVAGRHRPQANTGGRLDDVEASEVLATLSRNSENERIARVLSEEEDYPTTISNHISPYESRQEDEGPVYLGESNSVRYVHNDSTPGEPTEPSPGQGQRLLHNIPNAVKAESLVPEWEAERRQNRINSLRAEGVFSFPDEHVLETLLRVYFKWFHPCFAIVDEDEIWAQHRQGTLSPLLLHAILFISAIHCDDQTLQLLGLGHRHRAKYMFYNRAKDIYDADYERRKLTVIQALFLISFWRAGALLEKDARHWLGAAITLAQTKALHRAAGTEHTRLERVRRRLWWSLYVRERQCAAALGLPNRIRDEDCDCGPLLESDFEYAFTSTAPQEQMKEFVAYQMGMASLSKILGQIVHSGYLPRSSFTAAQRDGMRDSLAAWKRDLPSIMQLDNDFGTPPSFQTNTLHLAYNNLLILLYRSSYIADEGNDSDKDGAIALQAAARNSRIFEDMLPEGNLRHSQLHVITNLFNTLCIHTISLRRADGAARAIAEHRAKICLLGLQEMQKTWEVRNWVLQLFFQYLDRSTAASLQVQDDSGNSKATENDRVGPPVLSRRGSFSQGGQQVGAVAQPGQTPGDAATWGTDWSWSTEEQNQFLFSQIENSFAFGEGGVFDWTAEETFSSVLQDITGST